jgi:hypothetical protein
MNRETDQRIIAILGHNGIVDLMHFPERSNLPAHTIVQELDGHALPGRGREHGPYFRVFLGKQEIQSFARNLHRLARSLRKHQHGEQQSRGNRRTFRTSLAPAQNGARREAAPGLFCGARRTLYAAMEQQ